MSNKMKESDLNRLRFIRMPRIIYLTMVGETIKNKLRTRNIWILFLPDIFLETGLLLDECRLPVEATFSVDVISSPWSVSSTYRPSPLMHLEPPSKQNLPSTTPYLLKLLISHWPATLGGTPVVRQKPRSCTCSLAGPGGSLDFGGAEDTSTKKCGPSLRCELSFT